MQRPSSVPGTGLPILAYSVLVATSVALFLMVGGPLWSAPREASHIARFAVSYGAVIPLAALMLLALRRLRGSYLIASVGSTWAIKMVVTSVLFGVLARGPSSQPAAAPAAPAIAHGTEYRAAGDTFARGVIHGHVVHAGRAVAGAVIYLDAPAPGRPAPPASQLDLTISGSQYDKALYVAHADDEVRLVNLDSVLHTAHFHGAGKVVGNRPLPPSAPPVALDLPGAGLYQVRCDTHPGEGAWIVVVDHPYVTISGEGGEFTLEGVPLGPARVIAVKADPDNARRAEGRIAVTGAAAELTLDLADLRESSR